MFLKCDYHVNRTFYVEINLSKVQSSLTSSNSAARALCSGFLMRHLETKSINSGDHLSGLRKDGGGFVGIINMAWKIKRQLLICN